MRCLACNCELSDVEAVRKYTIEDLSEYKGDDIFVDLCDRCFASSELGNDLDIYPDETETLSENLDE